MSRIEYMTALKTLQEIYTIPASIKTNTTYESTYSLDWNIHASFPAEVTQYGKGYYSMLDYIDDSKAERIINCTLPDGKFPEQVHPDMDEFVRVLTGKLTAFTKDSKGKTTVTTLEEGQSILIKAATPHYFTWSEGNIVLNLIFFRV